MTRMHRYNPLQRRDSHGRWVAGGGSVANLPAKAISAGKKAPSPPRRGKSHGTSTSRNSGFVYYGRVNKRSQTAGFNAGRKIPGTKKRIVVGAYARLETTTRHTTADKIAGKAAAKVLPTHTKRGKAARAVAKNFSVNNPALRATAKGHQARLSTSRGGGPTVVVRRGKHKTAQPKSAAGVKAYDAQMRNIAGKRAAKKKSPRPQRRRAARRRR